jgi:hypothetical protein
MRASVSQRCLVLPEFWGRYDAISDTAVESLRRRKRNVAANPPATCANKNGGTSTGRIPANVLDSDRAIVTAGFANDVDAVNQYAAVM